ncbi:MAG: hypothetical protein HY238_26305, partial [Acidobacteria bacterium]|nr:hypothetical protein [Acidobacteriota bacterium]
MLRLRTRFFSALLLVAASGAALAQGNRIFLFPSGVSPNVTVLDAATLANVGTVVASPNAFLALGTPSGSKYYILSNNSVRTLTIVNVSNLSAPVYKDLGANASAGAITPDGKKVVVAAGTLKIYDTTTDQLIADVGVGGGPTELEVANDSSRAFVMSTGSGLVSIVDLTANPPVVTNQVSVSAPLSMALRPDNKSLLVLVPNGIRQINLKSGNISDPVSINNVFNGKVLATPDSARAVVINRGSPPLNVSQIVDLSGVNPAQQIGPANQTFDRIAIVDNSTAFGIVVGSPNFVVKIDLGTGSTTSQTYGQNARSLDVSPNGQALYVAMLSGSTGSVARVDVALNSAITQSLGIPPTGVSAVFPPPTTGAASMTINGGDRQNVIAGQAAEVPLSVKLVTADGSPVFNAPVTFAATAAGVTFSPTQPSRTNSRGIAQAVVTVAAASSLGREPSEQSAAHGSAASPEPVEQGIQTIAITASTPGGGAVNFTLTVGS